MYVYILGLKEVIKTVKDYCTLMKDFPLNSLQAANSLDAIKTALIAIYQHMRKIRNTSYPPSRAIHLLEAISRDLLTQTIKVSKIIFTLFVNPT